MELLEDAYLAVASNKILRDLVTGILVNPEDLEALVISFKHETGLDPRELGDVGYMGLILLPCDEVKPGSFRLII